MISRSTIQWVRSLRDKRCRDAERLFVAEGPKVVGDLLKAGLQPEAIFVQNDTLHTLQDVVAVSRSSDVQTPPRSPSPILTTSEELCRLSALRTPQGVVAIFRTPQSSLTPPTDMALLLDGVQDPGNVGTIIRLADWFSIDHIYLTLNCADPWGGKCVQAGMGSHGRVHIHFIHDTLAFATDMLAKDIPLCGCTLDGENLYALRRPLPTDQPMLLVVGSEGQGISPTLLPLLTRRITIPRLRQGDGPDSLNAAVATAIICSELCRQSGCSQ